MKKKIAINIFGPSSISLPLLIFLLFFFNVKFIVKLLALVFIAVCYKNFKFNFSWKQSRLPLFYLLIICIEIIKYLVITRNYSLNYAVVFGMGILQWGINLLAIHHIKLSVEQNDTTKIHNTIRAFFLLNFLVSFFFLMLLLFHPSWLAYWNHGADISFNHPSAGDSILGLTFDSSIVNATINSIGLIYFLYKKDYLFSFLNIGTIALCTSNVTFMFVLGTLILMILTVRSKKLRLVTVLSSVALITLYFYLSPKNREYIRNYFVELYFANDKPEQVVAKNTVPIPEVPADTATTKPAVVTPPEIDHTLSEKKLGKAVGELVTLKQAARDDNKNIIIPEETYKSKPGKLISFIQTYYYVTQDTKHFLFGAGMGNFSSKLAFRASGVNVLGSYPKKYEYTSPDFENNHLRTFLYYHNNDASEHSVLNYPFSVYNQILGEYGMIGTFLFIIFYLGYFLSRYRHLSYGKYMIVILLGFFAMEYWLEFFSLVVLFELLLLLNIKESMEAETQKPKAEPFTNFKPETIPG